MSTVEALNKVQAEAEESWTERLVGYVTDTTYDAIDSRALEAAVRPIVDTVGVILAGLGSEVGEGMTAYAKKQSLGARKGAWIPIQGMGVTARRSEERRVGKECVSTCRSRWW